MDNRFLESIQRRLAQKLAPLDVSRPERLRQLRAQLETDRRAWRRQGPPPLAQEHTAQRSRETIDRTLERLGFRLDGSERLTLAEADAMLARRLASDPELRMACKTRLSQLGMLQEGSARAATSPDEHPLHKLAQQVLHLGDEREDEDHDDHQEARGGRTLHAAARHERRGGIRVNERHILVNARGQPITLRCS